MKYALLHLPLFCFLFSSFSGEVNSQKNEMGDIERSVRNMQNDMTKLNVLIHKNRDKHQALQQDNILIEHDFIAALKVWMFH